ncbi:MAG TPA: hypothetical protein VGF48_02670 [Thermoanaerobaculia bacterium]|jgi:hypothetical protein
MGNRTTRKAGPRTKKGTQRPSTFFFIALGIGVLLLVWLMSMAVSQPMSPVQKTTTSRTSS